MLLMEKPVFVGEGVEEEQLCAENLHTAGHEQQHRYQPD